MEAETKKRVLGIGVLIVGVIAALALTGAIEPKVQAKILEAKLTMGGEQ